MSKKIKLNNKLSFHFFLISLLSLLTAFVGYYLVSDILANWVFESDKFCSYWESKSNDAIQHLQDYVTLNHLSVEDVIINSEWHEQISDILLFIQPLQNNDLITQDPDLCDEDIIQCANGTVHAVFYSPGYVYYAWWNIVGILFGFICFFSILIPYVFFTFRRIQDLYKQVAISISNDDYEIQISGNDEIAELGNEINALRQTLMNATIQEASIRKMNYQLVASLSHDIRTPLTKLIGYLEVLRYAKTDSIAYLEKTYEKAMQLKSLIDQLFYQFSTSPLTNIDTFSQVNGYELFSQLLYEWCCDLQAEGYRIVQDAVPYGDYSIQIRPDDIYRIFDNIFSNIKKYADMKHPIKIQIYKNNHHVKLRFTNYKNFICAENSHKIGLMNIQSLMKENYGYTVINDDNEKFAIEIIFSLQIP